MYIALHSPQATGKTTLSQCFILHRLQEKQHSQCFILHRLQEKQHCLNVSISKEYRKTTLSQCFILHKVQEKQHSSQCCILLRVQEKQHSLNALFSTGYRRNNTLSMHHDTLVIDQGTGLIPVMVTMLSKDCATIVMI